MITHFGVKNFKALRGVELDLAPLHVLIGPNDSGKTSILQALAAVCRSVDMPLDYAFAGRWQGRELVWREDKQAVAGFELLVTESDEELLYKMRVDFPLDGRNVGIGDESTHFSCDDQPVVMQELHPNLSHINFRAKQSFHSGPPDQDVLAKKIHNLLSGVQLYRWVPRFLSLPNAPDSSRRFRMEASGFGLALCLDDIMGYDRKLFMALEERFKLIFPEVEIIRLLPEDAFTAPKDDSSEVPVLGRAAGKGIYFQLSNGGPQIPASQVSDGMLLILAYLTILHLPEPPRLLLIEEPENGIHPERLKEVLVILRELIQSQQHTQVLMTTHSPYVVDMFKPEEVTLCFKGDDGAVKVRRLSESKAVREQVDVFTLGEIWTGDGDERLMEKAGVDEGAGE